MAGEVLLPALYNASTTPGAVTTAVRAARAALANGGVVVNSVSGIETLKEWFAAMLDAGLTAARYPVVSFNVGDEEVAVIGADLLAGHFSAWPYMQSVATAANAVFQRTIASALGYDRSISDAMHNSYGLVLVWAAGVARAGSLAADSVRYALYDRTFDMPAGTVRLDANNHMRLPSRVGKVSPGTGAFQIVFEITDRKSVV